MLLLVSCSFSSLLIASFLSCCHTGMASVPSPLADPADPQSLVESVKVKRLPRSAKKRLRYERIRQQRKQAGKKKKKTRPLSEGEFSSFIGELLRFSRRCFL